jgi:energy-coupling factor transporter ATP-binding protein EcfA2
MQLAAVSIQGFQSYRAPCTIEIDPHLTLLAGENNVGKSAFLRAMQVFLQEQEGATNEFRISFRWATSAAELQNLGLPDVELNAGANSGQILLTEHAAGRSDGRVGSQGGPHPLLARIQLSGLPSAALRQDNNWVWEEPETALFDARLLVPVAPTTGPVVRFVAPRRIQQGRRFLQTSSVRLEPDGANLTEVVNTLRANYSQTMFAEVQKAMRQCFPDIAELTVSIDEATSGGVNAEIAIIFKSDRSRHVPLRLCGSGVEQMLALIVGIVTARERSVFLIDEPQAFLHPHAERMLLQTIDKYRNHQYVIATHSNFLLGARPLSQSRLLTIKRGATSVTAPADAKSIFSSLGLTAADLWLPDFVLWGEGPSEVAALSLIASELPEQSRRAFRIRQMPAPASAFTGTPSRQGRALFDFCDEVTSAVASNSPRTAFVFDLDEKSSQDRAELSRASGDRAFFLEVRELENLFLDAAVIAPVLNAVAEGAGITPSSVKEVDARLNRILRDTHDKQLYPGGKGHSQVRGSAVLRRLWWDVAIAPYEKAAYADALTRSALENAPSALEPLRDVLRSVIGHKK